MNKQTILIIDDEVSVTSSLERNLREQFEVYTANTSVEAFDILRRHDIAVILADQRMPEMEGVEVLKAAQQISPESRSIILSGYSDVAALVTALNITSVRGYLTKPWNIEELRDKLGNAALEYTAIFHDASIIKDSTELIANLQSQINDLKKLIDTIQLEENQDPQQQENQLKVFGQQMQETLKLEDLYQPQGTTVSRQSFGLASLQQSVPNEFSRFVKVYSDLLEKAFEQRIYKIKFMTSTELRNLANELGSLRAGPRDVIEIHNQSLKLLAANQTPIKHHIFHEEGKLLVLELMGYLVLFYQRYFPK